MRKKLQVFISSTYTDLQDERQAAVEAVLRTGHIPAGMELFRSGDISQKETITKWIKESDVYLLILGGRYGSIEKSSQKSYTHWEYDLAGEIGIPRFAIIISEQTLNKKVKKYGQSMLERNNYDKYIEFKEQVLSKVSHFFEDIKDIKLTIMQTLNELAMDVNISGWVSGKNSEQLETVQQNLIELTKENRILKTKLEQVIHMKQPKESNIFNQEIDFSEQTEKIITLLGAKVIPRYESIVWYVYPDDDDKEVSEINVDNIKEHSFPQPPQEFTSYFILDTEEDVYKKLLIVTIAEDDYFNFQARLGDIRLLINQFRLAEGVPIKFVIAIPGEHGLLQDKVEVFLKKALDIEKVVDTTLFEIQIWDSNVINQFEELLGLSLSLLES